LAGYTITSDLPRLLADLHAARSSSVALSERMRKRLGTRC